MQTQHLYRHHHLKQAAELLAKILSEAQPADRQMERYFRQHRNMGSRDRGIVAETVYACLRNRRYYAAMAGIAEQTPLADYAAHLVAAFLLKDRHWTGAAIQEQGLAVNIDAMEKRAAELEENADFAMRANLPDWLAERLLDRYGESEARHLADALAQPAPVDLRANTLKVSRDELARQLLQEGFPTAEVSYSPAGLRRNQRAPLFHTKSFKTGCFELQDEGSQLISLLVEPQRREKIVDFCAGGGGKTLHLGALMANTGTLYALDIHEARLAKLKLRAKRAGLYNVRSVPIENESDPQLLDLAGTIDRVLVDAPCSGTGTLRRNPDIKWRSIDLAEITAIQMRILAAAAALLKNGGRLVYATCSILPDENEQTVQSFLAAHPNFRLISAVDILARHQIEIPQAVTNDGCLQLLPHLHGTDGFFAAVMQRSD